MLLLSTNITVVLFFIIFAAKCQKLCCLKMMFQRAYNDAYAYGALKLGIQYAIKSGLFTGCFLYVLDSCCMLFTCCTLTFNACSMR